MKRSVAILPLVALAGLGALFATFGLHHDPHFIPDALVGQRAPDETLPPLQGGRPHALKSDLRGPTVVNFFASNCAPCAEEAPALMALRAEGVRLVGVTYKDDPPDSRAFLSRFGDPFAAVLVDRGGRAALDFGVSGVPETFLIAADGRVLMKRAGALSPADAQALIERAAAAG
jgi:cytochrome c biogenesis protein CcmG, thiol:disulfide interchange protein DsbE